MQRGVYCYSSENITVLLKIQWMFVIVLSLYVVRNFRVHAHLLKC